MVNFAPPSHLKLLRRHESPHAGRTDESLLLTRAVEDLLPAPGGAVHLRLGAHGREVATRLKEKGA